MQFIPRPLTAELKSAAKVLPVDWPSGEGTATTTATLPLSGGWVLSKFSLRASAKYG